MTETLTVHVGDSFSLTAPGNLHWVYTIVGPAECLYGDAQGHYAEANHVTIWNFHAANIGTVTVQLTGQPQFPAGAMRSHMVMQQSYIIQVIA